jgi:hypothetical protein
MRSRLTSQYLSAETRSLSGCSPSCSIGLIRHRPESLARLCSLRLDFAVRQRARVRRAVPITIFPSLVLSVCSSDSDAEAAVAKSVPPASCFNNGIALKVSRTDQYPTLPGGIWLRLQAVVEQFTQPAQLRCQMIGES